MAVIPFFAILFETVGANSTATLQFQVAVNEEFTINKIRQNSSASFRITGIRDSRGQQYANLDTTDYAIGGLFADLEDANNGLLELPAPLVLPGGTTLYFDVRDASGASNDVKIFLIGQRKTG